MRDFTIVPTDATTKPKWMWKSNVDPWSKIQTPEWSCYSDAQNAIIEEAFLKNQTFVILDNRCIDFKRMIQIFDNDQKKQRPVRRNALTEDKLPQEERFLFDTVIPKLSFGKQYGWVPPFILEVRKSLKLKAKQLPSNDEVIIPMIVEKAALGIIDEGKLVGERSKAEAIAEELMLQKNRGVKEVWKCCANLYTRPSFLYRKLNEAMRFLGSEEDEQLWRDKVRTLGPFCLLLWDNPFKSKLSKNIILYRGVTLHEEHIATYQTLLKNPDEYHSFQAFTSCSRNQEIAELVGNALFIMEVEYAFTANIAGESSVPAEEEELIFPGVCFSVQRVKFDDKNKKPLIYLKLRQRLNGMYNLFYLDLCT
ncbi:unnamed protein product [Rotaria magnacalcarata]|uniref:NAD(P)(+)--arginine ADP-ribosyltransferase n=2 Tax=Rotaria magnacalcarata TaxID=392030 RepID=A0A816N6W2_9BILA|nr:unnamed protein product [Rotaria magnacalcarata]